MELQIVKRVFDLPKWYLPSPKETTRLFEYVLNEDTEGDARLARLLDCSAFCSEHDCFFCGQIKPVMTVCGESTFTIRRDC